MSMKRGSVPKMGDVSHVGATSKSYQLTSEKVPRGGRSSGSVGGDAVPPMLPQTPINNDIEDKEELRMRELEEARARAAQMEKTMRWWSDCTANWREKWGKVRAERNKSRDECRQLRMKVETTVKECAALKREKEELIRENEKLCKELHNVQQSEKEQASSVSSEGSTSGNKHIPERDIDPVQLNEASASKPDNEHFSRDIGNMEKVTKYVNPDKIQLPSPDEELAEQRVLMIEMKLEEATKTIQVERDTKEVLHKEMEKLQSELTSLKNRQEEMRKCKDETLKELSLLKQEHDITLGRITSDLEDEASTRSNMDRRLADMRKQLERLQAENAAEWGKRERLETEKLALERENKKLRAQLEDLEENLLKKNKLSSAVLDSDFKQNQVDLFDKTKELADLKHTQIKLRKILQDKTAELGHAQRQAEQHESEVKKLRARIEELKKDFARSEDEVDSQANNIRRLQRTVDEIQEQNEAYTVQVEHLQNRLRRQANTAVLFKKRPSKPYDVNDASEVVSDDDYDE